MLIPEDCMVSGSGTSYIVSGHDRNRGVGLYLWRDGIWRRTRYHYVSYEIAQRELAVWEHNMIAENNLLGMCIRQCDNVELLYVENTDMNAHRLGARFLCPDTGWRTIKDQGLYSSRQRALVVINSFRRTFK